MAELVKTGSARLVNQIIARSLEALAVQVFKKRKNKEGFVPSLFMMH